VVWRQTGRNERTHVAVTLSVVGTQQLDVHFVVVVEIFFASLRQSAEGNREELMQTYK
jgi:hypothetical protein